MGSPNHYSDLTQMTTEHQTIEVRLGNSYIIRQGLVAIVCLVLGVWGVWDYVEIIPRNERFFARAEVCRAFNQFAEPIVSGGAIPDNQNAEAFMRAVVTDLGIEGGPTAISEIDGLEAAIGSGDQSAIDTLHNLIASKLLPEAIQEAGQGAEPGATIRTDPTSTATWLLAESAMVAGTRTPTTVSGGATDVLRQGLQLAQVQLDLYGDVEQPSAYDRPVQWLFILCLPFVPYYLWGIFSNLPKRYALDTNGTLHLPGETWAPEDIADIDMDRWMRASKAWVVHSDGHRVLLDDYVFKGIFRIVGEIAANRYPQQWTDEARKVKSPSNDTAQADPED